MKNTLQYSLISLLSYITKIIDNWPSATHIYSSVTLV